LTKNIQDLPLKKLNTGKRGGPTIVDIFKTVHLKEKIVCGNFSDGLQMAMTNISWLSQHHVVKNRKAPRTV